MVKRSISSKIYNVNNLKEILRKNNPDKSIGLCHGVFDVLHAGHIKHFEECSKLVDVLIVSVTSDIYVNKGPGRPVNRSISRKETLAGIEYIDFVVDSNSKSAEEIIDILKPQIYFKGKDYADVDPNLDSSVSINLKTEISAIKKYGGTLHYTSAELKSSSTIINSTLIHDAHLRNKLNKYALKSNIQDLLDQISNLRISILGEIIQDKFIYTESLGKSSKHPLIAEKEIACEDFQGGVLPVIKTYETFINPKKLNLVSIHDSGNIPSINSNLEYLVIDESYKNILKTRYINKKTNTYMYEKYEFDDNYISSENEILILNSLKKLASDCDLLVVLDFGHGLITNSIRDYICQNFSNIALNVQKNAGNKGFNSVTKYKSASVVVLNGEEVELEFKQKRMKLEESVEILRKKMSSKIFAITDGANGLIITDGKTIEKIPALNPNSITDRTGAGDAAFAIISLFSQVTDDILLLGYLGNLAAAMNLTWIANQNVVSKYDLIRFLEFALK